MDNNFNQKIFQIRKAQESQTELQPQKAKLLAQISQLENKEDLTAEEKGNLSILLAALANAESRIDDDNTDIGYFS